MGSWGGQCGNPLIVESCLPRFEGELEILDSRISFWEMVKVFKKIMEIYTCEKSSFFVAQYRGFDSFRW